MKKSEEIAKNLLCMAGITINGSKEADIHIIQPDFYNMFWPIVLSKNGVQHGYASIR